MQTGGGVAEDEAANDFVPLWNLDKVTFLINTKFEKCLCSSAED